MKHSFIPRKHSELHTFEKNFINKLEVHAESLGMKPPEVADTLKIINKSISSYTDMISKQAEAKAAAAEYLINRKASEKELRRVSKFIKSSKKYTLSKGEDLQIIPPRIKAEVISELKPELRLRLSGKTVDIKFKKGRKDVFNIYSRRGDEIKFTFLSFNSQLHYSDDRDKLEPDKPEQREYFAYFKRNDAEVGKKSDIVKIVIP